MDKDLISVIIATKNGEQFLPRSIASVERQTEKNIELIIVSDGSTDNTAPMIKKMTETRPFIKLIELEKNIGVGLARNMGVKASAGKYVAILDDDDEWLDENKLKNQKKFLDENPGHVLVGAAETEFVNENGDVIFLYQPKKDDPAIRARLLISNQFVTSSVMFQKAAFEKAGGFPTFRLAEEYDAWLRLAQEGEIANIPGCKTRYFSRSDGVQKSNQREMNKTVLGLIKKYKTKFPHPWVAQLVAFIRILRG
jgi:glycosyltransferase involved in cell wall biosynthesis